MTFVGKIVEVAIRSRKCSASRTHVQLKRGLNGLATIGATAPFVGLFGTVIGSINSFRGAGATRATILSATAGGISEALVTTGLGLLVAVPSVWAYNYLTGRMELFEIEMNNAVEDVSAYLCEFQQKRGIR
ncbi:MAG TPA: MotA/TolQ/ExbB proton channel family protein [Candidatus Acidoferrales bacterium]|jgi:biopolymer transport protein ExbB/biopolymer transport protein TolQ|nr:MotA/TolQ/ExbB proton channel family protein [Candidatus Acidoferrales bacterium]